MIEFFISLGIIDIDHQIFRLINSEMSNQLFDIVLPWLRDKYFWLPVYTFIVSFCVINYKQRSYGLIIFLLVTVGSADFISSQVIKKNVQRIRPCKSKMLTDINVLVRCGSGYSFTSSHAANHFAISFFLIGTIGQYFKKIKGWLLACATLVSFAQVYVGVHFPMDVLMGALLGILIAKLFVFLYKRSGIQLYV